MKKNLLKLLICPICRKDNLKLIKIRKSNNIEIREGEVQCKYCNEKFQISEGILNLLLNPNKDVLCEQKGWERLKKAVKNTDKLMLSLPDACGEHKKYWKGQAENFHHIYSELNLKGDEVTLDLGAGRCWSTRFFSRRGCYSIAQDILIPKYVGLLTSDIYIYKEKIYFERICDAMEKIPFKDSIFDLVFMAATLHHSTDISITLKEIFRILKPKGRFVLINEPVKGIFRSEDNNNPEIEAGINENSYRLSKYLKELKKSSFDYKLEFWLGGNNKITSFIDMKLQKILPNRCIDNLLWRPLKYIQLLFFDGVLNLIAVKRQQ